MQAKRGAGRAARTPAERQDWTAHFKAQVQSQTPPAQARRERVQLARTHRRQKVLVPLTKLLWKRAPRTTPGGTEPTTKAATARISGPNLQRLEAQISAKRDQTRDELLDAETAVHKAERGAPRQQRTSAPASTTPRTRGPRHVRGGRP